MSITDITFAILGVLVLSAIGILAFMANRSRTKARQEEAEIAQALDGLMESIVKGLGAPQSMTMDEFLRTTNFGLGGEPGVFVRVDPTDASTEEGYGLGIGSGSGDIQKGNTRHDALKDAQLVKRLNAETLRLRAQGQFEPLSHDWYLAGRLLLASEGAKPMKPVPAAMVEQVKALLTQLASMLPYTAWTDRMALVANELGVALYEVEYDPTILADQPADALAERDPLGTVTFSNGYTVECRKSEVDLWTKLVREAQAANEALDIALAAVIRIVPAHAVMLDDTLQPHEHDALRRVLTDIVDREPNSLDAVLNAEGWRQRLGEEELHYIAGNAPFGDEIDGQPAPDLSGVAAVARAWVANLREAGISEEGALGMLTPVARKALQESVGGPESTEEPLDPSSALDNMAEQLLAEARKEGKAGYVHHDGAELKFVETGEAAPAFVSSLLSANRAALAETDADVGAGKVSALGGSISQEGLKALLQDVLTDGPVHLVDTSEGPEISAPETSSTHAREAEVSQTCQKCQEKRQNTGSLSQTGQNAALDSDEIDFGVQRFPFCTRFGRHARRAGYDTSTDEGSKA